MAELNINLYNASLETLTNVGIPEALADVASRIVATDDPTLPNLGRNDSDTQACQAVAEIYNRIVLNNSTTNE